MQQVKFYGLYFIALIFCLIHPAFAQQYKSYKLNANGDTLNAITKDNLKQGKWVEKVEELRGEPGFEEVIRSCISPISVASVGW